MPDLHDCLAGQCVGLMHGGRNTQRRALRHHGPAGKPARPDDKVRGKRPDERPCLSPRPAHDERQGEIGGVYDRASHASDMDMPQLVPCAGDQVVCLITRHIRRRKQELRLRIACPECIGNSQRRVDVSGCSAACEQDSHVPSHPLLIPYNIIHRTAVCCQQVFAYDLEQMCGACILNGKVPQTAPRLLLRKKFSLRRA